MRDGTPVATIVPMEMRIGTQEPIHCEAVGEPGGV